MTKLTIGCPVFERAWCLPLWFDSLEAQHFEEAFDEISLCFAYSKSYDGTYDVLQNRGSKFDELLIYQYDLPTFEDRDLSRFVTLAQLRNALLEMVKETNADKFLSWDNDILFQPRTLKNLWTNIRADRAIGALVDMGGNNESMGFPSVMHFPQAANEIAYRQPFDTYPTDEPFEADIIMAVKLMGREVYENTKYGWDPVGEDIAWCRDAANKGYKRYLDPRVKGIHLYDKPLSIEVMKTFPQAEYPEILHPLSRWWTPRPQWTLT